MIRTTHRLPHLALLTGSFCLATVAVAALKDKPPEGLSLSGTQWQIDPYHSDNPAEVIEKAEKTAQERTERNHGGAGDELPRPGDDSWRRGDFPGRTNPTSPTSPTNPTGPTHPTTPTSSDGGWGTPRGNPTDIDPLGRTQSASIQFGSRSRNPYLDQLRDNPKELTFRQVERHVTVTADGLETDCTAGSKEPLADSFGDGERHCGWNGRAWVVETTRGHNFSRTDRYELAKNGRTLRFITTASGSDMPNVRIERAYEVARPK